MDGIEEARGQSILQCKVMKGIQETNNEKSTGMDYINILIGRGGVLFSKTCYFSFWLDFNTIS